MTLGVPEHTIIFLLLLHVDKKRWPFTFAAQYDGHFTHLEPLSDAK